MPFSFSIKIVTNVVSQSSGFAFSPQTNLSGTLKCEKRAFVLCWTHTKEYGQSQTNRSGFMNAMCGFCSMSRTTHSHSTALSLPVIIQFVSYVEYQMKCLHKYIYLQFSSMCESLLNPDIFRVQGW